MTADDIIRMLELAPHPEGGYYRETFRDPECLPSGRNTSTAIYFLLPAGIRSRWHRVDAIETWLWHAGGPLELAIAADGETPAIVHLGTDFASGQRPQAIVPKGAWQQAEPLAETWCLVSCIVAPGFVFEGFELAPDGFHPGGIGTAGGT